MASKEIDRLKAAVETVRKSNERQKPQITPADAAEAVAESQTQDQAGTGGT